jgi:polyhydroxyalkanoate synthesis regulator phasin
MRQVTRLVLRKVGREDLYPNVITMYGGKGQLYIEHTSPLVEELIATGALNEEEVRMKVVEALVQARQGRRLGSL